MLEKHNWQVDILIDALAALAKKDGREIKYVMTKGFIEYIIQLEQDATIKKQESINDIEPSELNVNGIVLRSSIMICMIAIRNIAKSIEKKIQR